ncbi:MAG: asparagine synthase (glutamine-hydrolyzing) [Clostridia bacterium]
MCGIAGMITNQPYALEQKLRQAEAIQWHRGPDAQGIGIWSSGEWQVGLGHQRLSILDISELGTQPMTLRNEAGSIVYNGEVYNYREIRQELEQCGYTFTSDTDTEVILTALHHWGIQEATRRFNGMWAFAWIDHSSRRVYLSRDRFGVKPLYYWQNGDEFVFASEIKTILELANQRFSLNAQVIGEYIFQSLLATSEDTFFEGIKKVPPHHTLCLDLSRTQLQWEVVPYWSFPDSLQEPISESSVIEQIRELFIDAVRLRMRSDVQVGVLLSGGVDSSSIASVMNSLLTKDDPLHMLSAVSTDARFDESPFISIMGNYLARPVHQVVLDFPASRAFDYLETVTWYNDEPIGSFSTIAHYLLMEQAKQLGVTVILSGQGADELLCGYRKYFGFYLQALYRSRNYAAVTKELFDFWKQGTVLRQFSFSEAKRYLPALFTKDEIDISGEVLRDYRWVSVGLGPSMTVEERQMADVRRYSVPVLTHYEDRMSMAWSREVRLPFLDYRLVELLLALPASYKLRNGWTKYVFRRAMEPFLPKEIVWRKDKQGFVNPQSEWVKHELRDGILDYFGEDSLIFRKGIINRSQLLKKYERYCQQPSERGTIWFKDIFNPLALEIWLRRFERYIG